MSLLETQEKPTTKTHAAHTPINISLDGQTILANEGELLVEAILREKDIPHICYHSPLMGPIQSCDTCLVEVDGKLVRSCGTKVSSGMEVAADSKRARDDDKVNVYYTPLTVYSRAGGTALFTGCERVHFLRRRSDVREGNSGLLFRDVDAGPTDLWGASCRS
jgi:hypothetical protein